MAVGRNHGSRRVRVLVLSLMLVLGIVAARAPAATSPTLDYFRGEEPGDNNSFIEFDAEVGNSGFVKVEHFRFGRVDINCKYGDDREVGFTFSRAFKVGPQQHFRGTQHARIGRLVVTVRIRAHFDATGSNAIGKLQFFALGDTCVANWRARFERVRPLTGS